MRLTYQDIHWGSSPDRTSTMKAATGSAKAGVVLRACSYVTVKDGEAQIFRHTFGRSRPRLMAVGSGEEQVDAPPSNTLAIGRAIDLETSQGRILLGAGCFFATDEQGERVYLVGTRGVPYAIEQKDQGPHVTTRGIEA